MAAVNITVTIDSADAPDIIAAIERIWRPAAVDILGGDQSAYDALTNQQKAKLLLRAIMTVTTRNYRRELAAAALPPPTDPAVT